MGHHAKTYFVCLAWQRTNLLFNHQGFSHEPERCYSNWKRVKCKDKMMHFKADMGGQLVTSLLQKKDKNVKN